MANKAILLTNLGGGAAPEIDKLASGNIPLGAAIEFASSTQVKLTDTADSVRPKHIALRAADPDIEVSTTFADTAARVPSGDTVITRIGVTGEVYWMWLAALSNAAINSPLALNGDGTLKVISPGAGTLDGAIWGFATEAVDNSAGAVPVRVKVRMA
jgi:hypothetical protein